MQQAEHVSMNGSVRVTGDGPTIDINQYITVELLLQVDQDLAKDEPLESERPRHVDGENTFNFRAFKCGAASGATPLAPTSRLMRAHPRAWSMRSMPI